MLRRIGLLTTLLLLAPARPEAQPMANKMAQPVAADLHYVAYSTGLRVLDAHAALTIGPDSYRADLTLHTLGLFSVFVGGHTEAVARGAWNGEMAVPSAYDVDGHWDGDTLLTRIDYAGDRPEVLALLPDLRREREAVPSALQANTIDSLSAMAALVHRVDTTGRCDGSARVFDGRRLSQIAVQTTGMQVLPRTDRSEFAGQALRCDFDGTLLAGFKYSDNRARAARPRHGIAWFARIAPGGPLLPVRLQFATPFFEDVTMYLQP